MNERITWIQDSNPLSTTSRVDNFQILEDPVARSPAFEGLSKSFSPHALMSGNPDWLTWYYAIGTTVAWEGGGLFGARVSGIPGFDRNPNSKVELYVCDTLCPSVSVC